MTAEKLVELLKAKKLTITTAESCTGGLIAAAITDISGSSAVFKQGVVTYANEAKIALLGVRPSILELHGAVSEAVATAMASGALKSANADIAIAATGIAGPTGGTPEKPVGLVFVGIATKNAAEARRFQFSGTREEVRKQGVEAAVELALIAARGIIY